jgi:hypothetical protein
MVRKSKNKQEDTQLWDFDEELESPAVETESMKKRARKAKFFMFYAVSACVLTPVLSLGAFSGWVAASEVSNTPVSAPNISSPAKGAATKAVTEWVNHTPSPVPGGSVQSWDGFKTLTAPPSKDGSPVPSYEVHSFTVVSSTGRLYTSKIQMAYSDTSGVQVVGEPSLVPFAPDGSNSLKTSTPWPGYESLSISTGLKDAVSVWAAAYSGGNPATLRQVVGDPDSAHAYVPLSGVQKINNINVVAIAGTLTPEEKSSEAKIPARVVARVTFEVLWVGQAVKEGTPTPKITLDLLIEKANTGSPTIVAWGGPGEGFDLKPYGNALVGREVTVDDTLNKKLATITPSAPTTETPTVTDATTPKEDDSK